MKFTVSAEERQENSVYIVPDIETFIYTISLWDRDRRFPIFIGLDRFTRKFLDNYPGAKVVNVPKTYFVEANEETVMKALYAAWGPETLHDIKRPIAKEDIIARLREIGEPPRGIIFTNVNDRELAGGLALAAYHKELLDFLDLKLEKVKSFGEKEKEDIRLKIIGKIEGWGYEYRGIGNGIDFITLAVNIPFSYGGYSLDDAINREDPKAASCYAYIGRLVDGNTGMALYQANCSLFLPVEKALFFDRWPQNWNYPVNEADWNLLKFIPSVYYTGDAANMDAWRALMKNGNFFSFVFVQSSGGATNWQDGKVEDIPDSVPAIVYFSHSTSANNFLDPNTIAGRWLINGAYIYLGSITEPQNRAFQKSANVTAAIAEGLPVAMAFQRKELIMSRFAAPWKLIYIGDPMCRVKFAVRSEEEISYSVFKKGFEDLLNFNFSEAQGSFEEFIRAFPRSDLRKTALDLLEKIYVLKFYEYSSQKFPIQKQINSSFLKNWCLSLPSEARVIYDHLKYNKDRELKVFYQNLLYSKKENAAVTEMIKNEIKLLDKTIPFVKEWALIGPFYLEDGEKNKTALEPARMKLGKPVTIGEYTHPWVISYTDSRTNALNLRPTAKGNAPMFAYAVTFLSSKGDRRATFKVKTGSRFVLYVNDRPIFDNLKYIGTKKDLFPLNIKLTNGINKILVKTYRGPAEWNFSAGIYVGEGPVLSGALSLSKGEVEGKISGNIIPLPLEEKIAEKKRRKKTWIWE